MIRHALLHNDIYFSPPLAHSSSLPIALYRGKIKTMTTKINAPSFYSAMNSNDEQLFSDEQIQRYDADTIKHRYGENWRNYASNVREVKQADGSIVRGKHTVFLLSLLDLSSVFG